MAKARIDVICPCCHAKLVVDPESGLVLHSSEKKSGYSFEEALEHEKSRKGKADEMFQKAFSDEQSRHAALEKKFRQALESKDELDEPIRPLDLD
ncbi:MAG: hypothetical protein ACRD1R_13845 [Acidobacteriota bacterium]